MGSQSGLGRADYEERNVALLERRRRVKEELASAESDEQPRRELEEIETELVRLNAGLVRRVAEKFLGEKTSKETEQDILSAGNVGLIKAVDSYEPTRGPFYKWAYTKIKKEVHTEVYRADFSHEPRSDFDLRPRITNAVDQLRDRSGVEPDAARIAVEAAVPVVDVERVLEAKRHESLAALADQEKVAHRGLRARDDRALLRHEVVEGLMQEIANELNGREFAVFSLLSGLDAAPLTLVQIAELLGTTRGDVRDTRDRAWKKIQNLAEAQEWRRTKNV